MAHRCLIYAPPSTKLSEVAAYNNKPDESKNYKLPLPLLEAFKAGDYVPVVVYNAFVGSNGKGMRSLAQETHAHLFNDYAVLDEFDPAVDFSRTPDGHPLFEIVGYLKDLDGAEHLFFTLNFQKDDPKPEKLYPSERFPVGARPTVRIYRGRTRDSVGRKIQEVTGLITEKGLTIPPMTFPNLVNPTTGEVLPVKDLTAWLVAPDGTEHYACSMEIGPGKPPRFTSTTSEPDSIH